MADGPATSFADEGAGGDDLCVLSWVAIDSQMPPIDGNHDATVDVVREENHRFVWSYAESNC